MPVELGCLLADPGVESVALTLEFLGVGSARTRPEGVRCALGHGFLPLDETTSSTYPWMTLDFLRKIVSLIQPKHSQASAAKCTNLAFAGTFDYVAKVTIIFQLTFILANFFELITW